MKVFLSPLAAWIATGIAAWAAEPGWSFGIDVTLEAGTARQEGRSLGSAFPVLALGHLDWEQAKSSADGPVRFRAATSALMLRGRGPTQRLLGDLLSVSNIEGEPGTRLYSTWVEAEGDGWSLRTGALLADEEFAGTEAGGAFLNSAFGWPAFISACTVNTGPAFYAAALGLRFERKWGDNGAWRIGVYDGDTFDSRAGDPRVNRHGWRHRLGGEQGWFAIGEVAQAVGPWRLKAGSWLHTAEFADVRRDASGRPFADSGDAPRLHPGNYGAYLAAERTLVGETGKAGAVDAFLRGGLAPSDRNLLAWSADAGLTWTGVLPGRPADVFAVGLAHAAVSRRYAAQVVAVDAAAPAPDYERAVEVSYRLVVTPALSVVPDLQHVRHPGGSAAGREAWVALLRLDFRL